MRAHILLPLAAALGAASVVAGVAAFALHRSAPSAAPAPRNGRVQTFWPNGTLKTDVAYRADAYEGVYRTYYESGAPYELRHYVDGREQGLQQSWTEDGTAYLNYEVRNGRRYGLVNASPCTPVGLAAKGSAVALVPSRRPAATPTAASAGTFGESPPSPLPFYGDASFTPHWSPVTHTVAPFTLVAQTGDVVSSASLAGRPYVASFIYTQCAAVCPILVTQLARVQAASAGGAHIVSFSVTPETDSPQVLAAFGRERGIDPRTWSLVTGDRRTIYTLARTSFFADDDRVGAATGDASDFLHTEKLLLVDGSGRLRGVYNGTQPFAVDQLIADLSALDDTTPTAD